ncbi:MAG TPA: hypothetical protein VFT74_17725 [Isosphaeraceae bacterium]|nr:hypothetical protein [Isosphaeraceae bacterium]
MYRTGRPTLAIVVIAFVTLGAERAGREIWEFESDKVGSIARGFRQFEGQWVVVEDGDNQVLAQRAESAEKVFNLALAQNTSFRDVDLSVRVRAETGEVDQGGGIVWRAKDQNNYYIARYNPLEDNVRVYKVENGERTQLDHADAPGDHKWHTLRIVMIDREILGYFDDKRLLVAEDSTFREPGMVGLWTKADARSVFDDLKVGGR